MLLNQISAKNLLLKNVTLLYSENDIIKIIDFSLFFIYYFQGKEL